MTFDLALLDSKSACEDGAEMELLHPRTKQPLGAFITLRGKDSPSLRAYISRQQNDRLEKIRRGKAINVEQQEKDNINLLAQATTGWRGMVEDGEELPFSVSEAARVYAEFPWIEEQADAFIGDRANFLPD